VELRKSIQPSGASTGRATCATTMSHPHSPRRLSIGDAANGRSILDRVGAADTAVLSQLIRSLPAAEQRFTWLAMTDLLTSNATQHSRRMHADGRYAICAAQEDKERMLTCGQEGAPLSGIASRLRSLIAKSPTV
jgi:hypothetical protein